MRTFFLTALILATGTVGGCGARYHSSEVQDARDNSSSLTVGKVQREIKKGMTGDKVIESLGSPNIVSTDENGREVWVYDRFATDIVTSSSSAGVWLVLAGTSGSSGAVSSSQRTLTVVVKFDDDKRVRDVAYHSSKF